MQALPPFKISPPLINSATPWATTPADLAALYQSRTGAITIRTSMINGFPHNDTINQFTFFDPLTGLPIPDSSGGRDGVASSLNTFGYSPHSLSYYLSLLSSAARGEVQGFEPRVEKPIIVSVAGSAEDAAKAYQMILLLREEFINKLNLLLEVNLSCPNIKGVDPPAYNMDSLSLYLRELSNAISLGEKEGRGRMHVGLKVPPYTYSAQFNALVEELERSIGYGYDDNVKVPITFLTSTNTLGSALVLDVPQSDGIAPTLKSADGTGIGGMAGVAIHAISVGNVRTLRRLLDASKREEVRRIKIIGVGGVSDESGFIRMKFAGAEVVAVGTALGVQGVGVFEKILKGSRARL